MHFLCFCLSLLFGFEFGKQRFSGLLSDAGIPFSLGLTSVERQDQNDG
jgi:hypothetical protein